MKPTDYISLLKNLDKGDLKTFDKIGQVANKWISSNAIAQKFVGEIMRLFHDAYNKNPQTFVREIFFPNQLMLRATYAHQDFILAQFKKAKRISKLRDRQIALGNIYRNMVADLFDPYLSILVACIQLIEGDFHSFDVANLEKSEFHKHQFLNKRLKPTELFRGYFPIIRNAVSHSGSHSIEYDSEIIIFKKVRRDKHPSIGDVKKVTTSELVGYIQDIIDFVVAVETSINIMGLDMKDVIADNPEFAREFQPLLTPKQLASRRKKSDLSYSKVWHDKKLSQESKREHFIRLYAEGCQKNSMPAISVQFKDSFMIVQIPRMPLAGTEDRYLINRTAELINYLLLAEMYFHFEFSDYLVEEVKEPSQVSLQLWLKSEQLRLYNIGEADIFDLMHDGKLYKNTKYQPVIVDFTKLEEVKLTSLKPGRKRKRR